MKIPRISKSGSVLGRTTYKDIIFHFFNYSFFIIFTILCFYPFYFLFLVSVSSPIAVSRGDVFLWPVDATFDYYLHVTMIAGISRAFLVSFGRVVIGTSISVFFTTMIAYVLTKPQFKCRKVVYWMTVFTLYVSAGLIPYVVTMYMLGLNDTFLIYILPSAVSAFNMVLVKTYIESLPIEVEESAIIDGASYFTILTRLIFPMSLPIIATIAIFSSIGHWNAFQDNLYLVRDRNLMTLQLMLWNVITQADAIARQVQMTGLANVTDIKAPSPLTIRSAISVLTMVPIMLVYPFAQRFFISGIMLGAVKG